MQTKVLMQNEERRELSKGSSVIGGRLSHWVRTIADPVVDFCFPRTCVLCYGPNELEIPSSVVGMSVGARQAPSWTNRWGFDSVCSEVTGIAQLRPIRIPRDFFCAGCLGALSGSAPGLTCCRCGHPVADTDRELPRDRRVCAECLGDSEETVFDHVFVLGRYSDVLREAVIAAKQSQSSPLAIGLGNLLAWRLRSTLTDDSFPDVVTCVPSHWTRRFHRRSWPTQWLASEIGANLGVPFRNVFRMVRRTKKQGMLSDVERRDNVNGAFALRRSLKQSVQKVLIVDDVWTTGSTMRAAAKVLNQSHLGVTVYGGIVARAVGKHRS